MKKQFGLIALALTLTMNIGMASIIAEAATGSEEYWKQAVAVGIVGADVSRSQAIKRGEFVDLLWKLSGKPEPNEDCPFSDVAPETTKAAASLFEKGVVSGYGGGVFAPNDPVTIEMAYVMAVRNWRFTPDNSDFCDGYKDAAKLSKWARSAVSYIFEQGLNLSQDHSGAKNVITYDEAVSLLISIHQKEYFRLGGGLDAFIENLAVNDRFSGTVIIGKDNEILYERAFGYANRETLQKMETDTKINLGSINKSFTAVAICQLIQAGKLSYSDTLETYLPEFAELSKGRITIEQILTHTAGLGNFRADEGYMKNKDDIFTTEELLPYTMMDSLLFEPGTENSYSNSGFVILGAIIERVTGEDYFDYINEHVFAPAGMESSTYEYNADDSYAKGYVIDADRNFIDNNDSLPPMGCSAGGGYSTAGDMLRFMNALNNDVYLTDTFAELFSDAGEGYGMYKTNVAGNDAIGMSGGAEGIASTYETYPESGYSVAILTNTDDRFNSVFGEIKRFLFNAMPAPSMSRSQVEVNGTAFEMSVLLQNDEVLLPLFDVCEALGATVAEDTIELNGVMITVSAESVTCTANGEVITIPTRRMMAGGRAMVFAPMLFYIETFGCQIIMG